MLLLWLQLGLLLVLWFGLLLWLLLGLQLVLLLWLRLGLLLGLQPGLPWLLLATTRCSSMGCRNVGLLQV